MGSQTAETSNPVDQDNIHTQESEVEETLGYTPILIEDSSMAKNTVNVC